MDTGMPPAGDQQQTAYAPPPPPPPQQKKGFNWLACCGISCLVIVIIGALMAYGCYRMGKPMFDMAIQMSSIQSDVTSTDAATIRSAASPVSPDEYKQAPDSFDGQWLAIEGVLSDGSSIPKFSGNEFDTEGSTQYIVDGDIFVLDFSGAPKVGQSGDTIRAYGKALTWDFSDMSSIPFVGKAIEEEMKKDPSFANQTSFTYFIAKEVELVSSADAGDTEESGEPTEESDGWIE